MFSFSFILFCPDRPVTGLKKQQAPDGSR